MPTNIDLQRFRSRTVGDWSRDYWHRIRAVLRDFGGCWPICRWNTGF